MRKKFFRSTLSFLFLLTISLFSPTFVYAQCELSLNQLSFPYNFNGDVTISSISDCFQASNRYIIVAYPESVELSPARYANYSVAREQPTDARTLTGRLDLFQGSIGKNNPGTWHLKVCLPGSVSQQCRNPNNVLELFLITVTTEPAPTPSPTPTPAPTFPPPPPVCPGSNCPTALGDIPTNPAGLVTKILEVLLYLSGGIAVLLIIYSGYRMMTSQGNPEALQGAKETLTSAIVGLLFIIFSLVLLQIIGVDILRIPGFGK